ncbi:Indole-3-acetic acid-induced protein ARG7 [Acorus calamus]|uniref:Indole-3-acetic acid-induced protein ARG7 n=1 Tax=Acorus calamus TaxID=4465 RepID=A0AAV9CPR2_ACOCL|nr:Indole-3-acetic acid-induced protein ARG7 [Acorus calamus]
MEPVSPIARWKRLLRRWKDSRLLRRLPSTPRSASNHHPRIPPGHLAVYVGTQRRRFVIPTRYLNLPIFVSLLKKAEEEFGFESPGGLTLPCDPDSFEWVLKALERDERGFRDISLDEALRTLSLDVDSAAIGGGDGRSCKGFSPLLDGARVGSC